jgi:signal transduction histidine kinase
MLARALRNLGDNAARHATMRVALAVRTLDATVEVSVDDDGSGIPLADRERVLERFVRLDEGRARDAGGSGLGLAIVAEVVRAHGGSLRVAESPLGGARFVAVFPGA